MSTLRVAVVAGGPSAEAEVSRTSARAVAAALGKRAHDATLVELDRDLAMRLAGAFDVVFPAVHGPVGEDGCLQGLLEVLELPYVGSGVLASALCMNKPMAKRHFRAAGIPVAEELTFSRNSETTLAARLVVDRLGGRVAVKPASGGSAIGVELVREPAELADALGRVLADDDALVEPLLTGLEVTCGVLEDDAGEPRALPPTLIIPKAGTFYDFRAKYAAGGSEHRCPAPFGSDLTERIQALAVDAHRATLARDLSRADFVVDERAGAVTLLEVNTLPGMTSTSLFPEAAAAAGTSFEALCDLLVRRAAARGPRHRVRALAMP